MKQILLFLVSLSLTCMVKAQTNDKLIAMQLVTKNSQAIGLSKDQLDNLLVSSSYYQAVPNIRMVYLLQSYKGLPVYNQMLVLAFRNEQLVSKAGELITDIEKRTGFRSATPAVGPADAVRAAIAEAKIAMPTVSIVPLEILENNRKVNFGPLGIASENVTAELMWVPVEGKEKAIKLAWQVELVPTSNSDYWNIRIDATNNTFLNKINLTVYENFDLPKNIGSNNPEEYVDKNLLADIQKTKEANKDALSPSLVGTANYLVIPYPAESPQGVGGTAALRTNPWTLAGGNAVSLGWHNDGTTDYTITRGNNVWAKEDRAGSNSNTGVPATSTTTPDPLNFNFPPDYTVAPTTLPFQQFAITNLFYWNNLLHDMSYNYGFDEVSGNFQNNNQGRGGLGNDAVYGDAQDGGGTNNANFATPVDGQKPRMQMYLFDIFGSNPIKDGDIDNGVVCHEFGHGISTRLTGGPANSSCLGNAEEGGEGWSDFNALMMVTDWSTATITDGFNVPRPMGLYVLNNQNLFAGSAPGTGIRHYKYCTNMAVNPLTYAWVAASGGEVHDIGELWCETLWDMTWNIIQMDGINPNLFNSSASGGNTVAWKLVMEGFRLQPCSPGFIDARNAILKADTLLFNHQYSCAIWDAFARRGMGRNASQGSSQNTGDQVVDFTNDGSNLLMTQNVSQQQEGLNIIYTNHITAGTCTPMVNYLLTDTLPANVTYVSGGTYTSANRVVSFPVNLAGGTSQDFTFTVQINFGSYFPPVSLLNEPVAGTTIPASWTATTTTATNWVVSSAQSHSAPNSFFGMNLPSISDEKLETTNAIAIPASAPPLTFWGFINSEPSWDGGVVEISTNGGPYTDMGANMTSGGYNGTLNASGNPLSARPAFTGNGGGFVKTTIDMTPYAGTNAKIRFRFGSDGSVAATGWYVDDIQMQNIAVVNMRSNLFNGAGIRVSFSDTVTLILPNSGCTTGNITAQPANTSTCPGTNASFSVAATGDGLTYQWQVSINGGGIWNDLNNIAPYSGVTTPTLSITGATAGMDTYQYRVVINGTCTSNLNSAAGILTISSTPTITSQPANVSVCPGQDAVFSVTAGGSGLTYQWQVNTGSGFNDILGATSSTLTLTAVTAGMNNYQYQVKVTSCGPATTSNPATLLVGNAAANITAQPVNTTVCAGSNASFSVTATGSGLTYQWQVNTGTGFTDIAGATSSTLTLTAVTAGMNTYQYQVNIFSCGPIPVTSSAGTLTVNSLTAVTTQPADVILCAGANASFSTTATGTGITYQWQVSTSGCAGPWVDISGATSATLNLNAVPTSSNGYRYRVIVTGTCNTITSSCAALTVNSAVTISAQPADVVMCLPGSASFSVTASGTGLTYQWQVSTDGGFTFTDISGATGVILNLTLSASMNGNQYRVVLNGTCTAGLNSAAATLTVNSPVAITTQPANITGCAGTDVVFSVTATGSTITYQWQVSINGGGFVDLTNTSPYSGVTTNTLTISPSTTNLTGNSYRVVVSGVPCGAVTSEAVSLTVNVVPVVVLTTASYLNINPGVRTTVYSTVSPPGNYSYQWFLNGVLIPVSSTSTPVTVDGFGDYEVVVTNLATNCFGRSNIASVHDSASTTVFIYPNPNSGQFQVRFYNPNATPTSYQMSIYDAKGSRVYTHVYPVTNIYERMDVDMTNSGSGIYMLDLRDANGKRLGSAKFMIGH